MAYKVDQRGIRDVPIKIDGTTRFIKNVTKCTTCCDVIKMLLKKLSLGKENLASYAIFESANGVDRPLAGKTSLLKTVRSWGSDANYQLVFRKSAPAVTYIPKISEANRQKLSQWSKSSSTSSSDSETAASKGKELSKLADIMKIQRKKYRKYRISDRELSRQLFSDYQSDDDSMDEFMSNVDPNKLTDFWNFCNVVTETEIKRLSHNSKPIAMLNSDNICEHDGQTSKVKYAVKKKLKHCADTDTTNKPNGKQELMDKYLFDYASFETPKIGKMKKVTHRNPSGNITTVTNHSVHRTVKPSITSGLNNVKYTENYTPNRQAYAHEGYWSAHGESDSDTTDSDSSFEKAFISESESISSTDDCSVSAKTDDSGINVKYVNDIGGKVYRACIERKLVDYSISEDEYENDLIRSFNVCQFWDNDGDYDEDQEMESFMNTKIHEDMSDEGISSVGSDEEREILV